MREIAIVLCTWLHLMVIVIWLGHMANALLLFGPLSTKYVSQTRYGDFIAEYRSRDAPVAIGCIAVFVITGLILTLLDEQYTGFGNIFANNWSTVLFIKHVFVLAMIGLGIYQGSRVMPGLGEAWKKLADENRPDVIASVTRLEKKRKVITQTLCSLAVAVLLLTAIGGVL